MAAYWTTTEPQIPSGAEWSEAQEASCWNQSIAAYFLCSIVRLNRTQVCCRVQLYTERLTGASYTESCQYLVSGGQSSGGFSVSFNTTSYSLKDTRYYIADAAPGEEIGIKFYVFSTVQTDYVYMVAPDFLLPEIKAKVNGEIVNIAEVYVNVGGEAVPVEEIKFWSGG